MRLQHFNFSAGLLYVVQNFFNVSPCISNYDARVFADELPATKVVCLVKLKIVHLSSA